MPRLIAPHFFSEVVRIIGGGEKVGRWQTAVGRKFSHSTLFITFHVFTFHPSACFRTLCDVYCTIPPRNRIADIPAKDFAKIR